MRQESTASQGQPPLTRISREGIATTHRFYDSSPLSPSGEYVALTEFPYENKLPVAGDAARVVVRSVTTGEEIFGSETIAWDTQLGAQAQWGATDEQLVFNRMDASKWIPYGVVVDPFTGLERRLGGSVYMVDRSGEFAVSPNLKRMKWAQPGYGVHVPEPFMDSRVGIPRDDGVFRIDLVTGIRTLLVSLDDIVKAFPEQFSDLDPRSGGLIGFHTKITHDGKRIMFLIRWLPKNARPNHTRNWIITMARDGSDLSIALDAARWAGGHHPNWQPDGKKIIMNLVFDRPKAPWLKPRIFGNKVLRRLGLRARFNVGQLGLAQFDYRGTQFSRVAGERIGSGHPSVLNDGSILTDAYPTEPVAAGDGTVPIRLISADGSTESILAKFRTQPDFNGAAGEWRVDPHPAVDRDQKRFVVNSYTDGYRAVYLGALPVRTAATTESTIN